MELITGWDFSTAKLRRNSYPRIRSDELSKTADGRDSPSAIALGAAAPVTTSLG